MAFAAQRRRILGSPEIKMQITKRNSSSLQHRDEIYPADFEGEIKDAPAPRTSRREKPTGAFLRVHEIEGVAFFFLAAGGIFGHSIQTTKWGSEFALFGLVIGFCFGVLGREKIQGLFRKCLQTLRKNSQKRDLPFQYKGSGDGLGHT